MSGAADAMRRLREPLKVDDEVYVYVSTPQPHWHRGTVEGLLGDIADIRLHLPRQVLPHQVGPVYVKERLRGPPYRVRHADLGMPNEPPA